MKSGAVQLIACVAALFVLAGGGARAEITAADYIAPTRAYDHGILGDAIEFETLRVEFKPALGKALGRLFHAPEGHVFEDIAPRLWDVDGDGAPEVVAILTNMKRGASLAVFDETGLVARTPFIGRTHRWLAPVGVADLDGDGRTEIAYVDRPHLAKVLRVWRLEGRKLRHVADIAGLTNHKIGWDIIPGGVRDCGEGPEMITADAGWTQIVATTFKGGVAKTRAIAPFRSTADFAPIMACQR